MKYLRLYVSGGTYFFTLVTEKRRPILVKHVDSLRDAFQKTMKNHPFSIKAIVILPDHLHTLWTLPPDDADFSTRLRLIKRYFSLELPEYPVAASQKRKGEKGIWQRRYWEHLIRDDVDLNRHYDYIHYNPVKHGLVPNPADWEYSSIHKCVAQGLYSKNWGASEPKNIINMELD